ncbi:structure-specific DNA nuclease regulator Pxd1 [Schizosaccharomyces osmophilus]|uniref:Structure-specific DNA nuclease regulator Pxd1 n=1 Tax=Schizosaccharomyces osmophilus TaxID=2545709 RepID=A0AAE9WHQ0_9SCHI|nr:structure-specific DNA nuclease regulator Pxd1 [Schizosaccharomyces osmophilus]WBW75564.1 structure-specific DNA nuclease regulator Pxd1 [Schizosaccharomyces osmophilus]
MNESKMQESEGKNEMEQKQEIEKDNSISSFSQRLQNFRYHMKSHSRPRQQTLHSFVNKESQMVEDFSKIGKITEKEKKSKVPGNTITSRVQKSFRELYPSNPSPKKNPRKENIGKETKSPLGFFGHIIPKKKPIIPLKPSSGIGLERAARKKVNNALLEPRVARLYAKSQKAVFPTISKNQNSERGFSESELPQKVTPYLWTYPSRILKNQVVDEHGNLKYNERPDIDMNYWLHLNPHSLKGNEESYDLEKSGMYFGMLEFPTSDSSEESFDSSELLEAPADEVENENDTLNEAAIPSMLNSSNITRFFKSHKGRRLYAQFLKCDAASASIPFRQIHNDLVSHGVHVDFRTLNNWLNERNIPYV